VDKKPTAAKDFYAPREVVFNRITTLWAIQNLGCLTSGKWPHEPTNYTDTNISNRSYKQNASFITPVDCAAEVTTRMEFCGVDGLILLALECWGESPDALAKYLKMPVWSIIKRGKKALRYVSSGPDRRWHNTKKRAGQTYQEFIRKQKQKEVGENGNIRDDGE